MTDTTELRQLNNEHKSNLRRYRVRVLLAILIILLAISAATFAWYIYNTKAHTTNVHMAAGTSTKLEIAKEYDGPYSLAIDLDAFQGELDPVSTDSILGGFQKVSGYEGENLDKRVASVFKEAERSDYFKTTLYIRTNAKKQGIYVSSMEYDDSDNARTMATAVRVGVVVYRPGDTNVVDSEYIFELSKGKNPDRKYNTKKGYEGCVLDSSKTDGTVVDFRDKLLSSDNFANYDKNTGEVSLKAKSKELFELKGASGFKPGKPVKVDIYVWLEGCDSDCTSSMSSMILKDIAISFASYSK